MITENGSNIGHSTLFFLHHRTPTKSRNGWKWVSNSIKHNHQASNLSISPDWSKPKCTYISKCWKSSFRPHFNWCNNYKPYISLDFSMTSPWCSHVPYFSMIFLCISHVLNQLQGLSQSCWLYLQLFENGLRIFHKPAAGPNKISHGRPDFLGGLRMRVSTFDSSAHAHIYICVYICIYIYIYVVYTQHKWLCI